MNGIMKIFFKNILICLILFFFKILQFKSNLYEYTFIVIFELFYIVFFFGDGVADFFVIVWYGTCRGKEYTFTERKVLPVFLLLAHIGSLRHWT